MLKFYAYQFTDWIRHTYAELMLARVPRYDALGYTCSDLKRNEILRKHHPRAAAIMDPILEAAHQAQFREYFRDQDARREVD